MNYIKYCNLDIERAMQQHELIIGLIAAYMGNNASNDIAISSYKWAPLEHQLFLWGLSKLHSNELDWIVPKLSF